MPFSAAPRLEQPLPRPISYSGFPHYNAYGDQHVRQSSSQSYDASFVGGPDHQPYDNAQSLPSPISPPLAYPQPSYPRYSNYPPPLFQGQYQGNQGPPVHRLPPFSSDHSGSRSASPPATDAPRPRYYDPRNQAPGNYFDHQPPTHFSERPPYERARHSWAGLEGSWNDPMDARLPTPQSAGPGYHSHDGYFQPRNYGGYVTNERGPGSPRESEGSHESQETERSDATTPFISKLAHLLSHTEYSQYIRWTGEGTAFIFAHGSTELLEIFSRFFRHSNCHSFVRQLNIYGFTRLTTLDLLTAIESAPHPSVNPASEFAAFAHPLFFRAPHCRLGLLKPKAVKSKKSVHDVRKRMSVDESAGRRRSLKGDGKVGGTLTTAMGRRE